jgi:hypothetical protein
MESFYFRGMPGRDAIFMSDICPIMDSAHIGSSSPLGKIISLNLHRFLYTGTFVKRVQLSPRFGNGQRVDALGFKLGGWQTRHHCSAPAAWHSENVSPINLCLPRIRRTSTRVWCVDRWPLAGHPTLLGRRGSFFFFLERSTAVTPCNV